MDSTTCRAHVHAAGTRRDSPRTVDGEPDDHALGRSRGGWSTKTHAAVDAGRGVLACVLSAGQAAHCPMMVPVLEAIRVAHRGRGRPRPAPEAGAGRQGLLLTGQPGLAARPPHPRHDPGQGRPGGPPSRQRLTRWTPTGLRRRDVQEPQHRGTRLQSPQAPPSPGHPLRQARRALPDNHPHHQHQPPAQTTYITGPRLSGEGVDVAETRQSAGSDHLAGTSNQKIGLPGPRRPGRYGRRQPTMGPPYQSSMRSLAMEVGPGRRILPSSAAAVSSSRETRRASTTS